MIEQGTLPEFDQIAAAVEGIGWEEARAISAEAMEGFEGHLEGQPALTPLAEGYFALRAQGWPWRKALYIAWARLPRQGRWPETQGDLASLMGLRSARTIRTWRAKNPAIDQLVRDAVVGRVMERSADVLEAAMDSALGESYRGFKDRQMLLEIMGVYRKGQDIALTTGPVNADEMARKRGQAEVDAAVFEAERFGEGDGDEGLDEDE